MEAITQVEKQFLKKQVSDVQSGDTVRVHQLIKEGAKQRVQVFEGVIIRTHRLGELSANITVRRIASGVGVEKTFLLHSPNVEKVEILRRAKVRHNFLSYLRGRRGKSARLQELSFDKNLANVGTTKADQEDSVVEDTQESKIEESDEALTEISESGDSIIPEVSLEDVIKDENKASSVGDSTHQSDDPGEEGDEIAAVNDEVQSGLERAESQDSNAQHVE